MKRRRRGRRRRNEETVHRFFAKMPRIVLACPSSTAAVSV
jgi:hypothetical protein